MSDFFIKNMPSALELWKGIGGHFDSLVQILCEFIDNSISNLKANNLSIKNIIVKFYEEPGTVRIFVEDTGSGIKNLNAAFTLGSKEGAETPLNEHGFGFKHALASANPNNDSWRILTRTDENARQNRHISISAPYEISGFSAKIESDWAGPYRTGTIVEFTCTRELFNTIHRGMRGAYTNFNNILDILVEDLGFIYAGNIKDGDATIMVEKYDNQGGTTKTQVSAIEPDWEQYFTPKNGSTDIDLGHGRVKIEYSFGGIKEKTDCKKYYKRNMSSSGVEIRINGRVLAYNMFKEIWATEKHNSYNHLLVQINIVSDVKESLPATRTSKNGLREGDLRLDNLYKWIRSHMPVPPKYLGDAESEVDLIEELEKAKIAHLPEPKTVTTEQYAFVSANEKIRIDLYIR